MLVFLVPSMLLWPGMTQDWIDALDIAYTADIAFMIGAVLSLPTILWSLLQVKELPLAEAQRAHIAAQPSVYRGTFNMVIVIPMLLIALTLPLFCAAAAVFWTREPRDATNAGVARA